MGISSTEVELGRLRESEIVDDPLGGGAGQFGLLTFPV